MIRSAQHFADPMKVALAIMGFGVVTLWPDWRAGLRAQDFSSLPPLCENPEVCNSSTGCGQFCFIQPCNYYEHVWGCVPSTCGESATCATDAPCDEFCSKKENCGETCRDKDGFTKLCQPCSGGDGGGEEGGDGSGGCTYRPCSAFDLSRKLIGQFQGQDGYVYNKYCGSPIRDSLDCTEFCPDKIWSEKRCVGAVTPWSIGCTAPGEGKDVAHCGETLSQHQQHPRPAKMCSVPSATGGKPMTFPCPVQ